MTTGEGRASARSSTIACDETIAGRDLPLSLRACQEINALSVIASSYRPRPTLRDETAGVRRGVPLNASDGRRDSFAVSSLFKGLRIGKFRCPPISRERRRGRTRRRDSFGPARLSPPLHRRPPNGEDLAGFQFGFVCFQGFAGRKSSPRNSRAAPISHAPVLPDVGVRGVRAHTISEPGFNLFKALRRHFRAQLPSPSRRREPDAWTAASRSRAEHFRGAREAVLCPNASARPRRSAAAALARSTTRLAGLAGGGLDMRRRGF